MPTPDETARAATRRVAVLDEIVARRRRGERPPFLRELAREHDVADGTIRKDLAALTDLGVIERDGTAAGIRLHEDKLEALRASAAQLRAAAVAP